MSLLVSSIAHSPSPPVVHGALGKTLFGGSNEYGFGSSGAQEVFVGGDVVSGVGS